MLKATKFYTSSLLIELYQIAKRDNSCPILKKVKNPKRILLASKSPLKVQKSDPGPHILKLYSLRPIQIRYPEQDLSSN